MFRLLACCFVLVLVTVATWAQTYVAPGHGEFHAWYQQIQKELGISNCCDEQSNDCGPIDNDYVDHGDEGVKVLLEDGQWYLVPSVRKHYVATPDGGAHVCRQPPTTKIDEAGEGFSFQIYCVFLPLTLG